MIPVFLSRRTFQAKQLNQNNQRAATQERPKTLSETALNETESRESMNFSIRKIHDYRLRSPKILTLPEVNGLISRDSRIARRE